MLFFYEYIFDLITSQCVSLQDGITGPVADETSLGRQFADKVDLGV